MLDHEPINPIEGTTINSQIDDNNFTDSVPVTNQSQQEPEKDQTPLSIPSIIVSSLAKPTVDEDSVKSKLKNYHIERNPEYFGFGIILHTDKDKEHLGENLSYPSLEIEKSSPADASGLKTGQRLIAVNCKLLNKDFKNINELAQAIDDAYYQRGSTDFVVLDEEVWDAIKSERTVLLILTSLTPDELKAKAKPQESVVQPQKPIGSYI